MTTTYLGRCHCGAIGFRYSTELLPSAWSVRACQCSFCKAHDALSTSDPAGYMEFVVNDDSVLQSYRFGLKTADFLLCRNCGVYIGARIDTKDGCFGIVNIHAFKGELPGLAPVAPISYDNEDTGSRIGRRQDRWTPVGIASGGGQPD